MSLQGVELGLVDSTCRTPEAHCSRVRYNVAGQKKNGRLARQFREKSMEYVIILIDVSVLFFWTITARIIFLVILVDESPINGALNQADSQSLTRGRHGMSVLLKEHVLLLLLAIMMAMTCIHDDFFLPKWSAHEVHRFSGEEDALPIAIL